MIIYRLSSPYLHGARSPFPINQERGSLEQKSVLLQSPGRHTTDAPIWPPMGPRKSEVVSNVGRVFAKDQDDVTGNGKGSAASKSEVQEVDKLNI